MSQTFSFFLFTTCSWPEANYLFLSDRPSGFPSEDRGLQTPPTTNPAMSSTGLATGRAGRGFLGKVWALEKGVPTPGWG